MIQVVPVIDPRVPVGVDVRWRDPFDAARLRGIGRCDAGCPAAGTVVNEGMAAVAGEILVGDVGGAAVLPFGHVVHGCEGRRSIATGARAPARRCDEGESLIRRGEAPGATEVKGSAVVVENGEYRVGVLRHAQCIPDGNDAAGGGGRHAGRLLELVYRHGEDRRHR